MTSQPQNEQPQNQPEKKRQRKPRGRANGEGSVFKRGDDRSKPWVAQITLNGKRTPIGYFRTEAEAITARNKALRDLEQGIWVASSKQTVAEYMEYWLEKVHKPAIKITTYQNNRDILDRYILPALGHIQVQKLTMRHVQIFCTDLQKTIGAGRIRNVFSVLHGALEHAVQEGLVVRNVSQGVQLPRIEETERTVLTVEQASQLLDAASEHWMKVLLAVTVTTGLRRGELLALKWQDLNLEKRTLQVERTLIRIRGQGLHEVRPKTAKSRRKISLPLFVVELLQAHKENQEKLKLELGDAWQEKGLVFCGTRGNYLRPMALGEHFSKILIAAQLPHMRFHDLRHSALTLLTAMGAPAKVVQEIAGHSHINITLGVYGHVIPGMHEEAMEIWDNTLGGKAEQDLADLRLQWDGYSAKTQKYLEMLLKRYGREAVMLALYAIQNL